MAFTIPDLERRSSYVNGSLSTTPLDVTFVIFELDQVDVYIDGVLQSGNYTVTGTKVDGVISDAQVVPDAPGYIGTIEIVSARAPERVSQFQEGADLPVADLNLVLNIIAATTREIYDRVRLAVRAPFGTSDLELEKADGEVIGWSPDGLKIEGKGSVDGLLTASAAAVAAQADIATRYLGAFASNPSGTVVGQLYFNTTAGEMRVWDGGAWVVSYNPATGAVTSFNTRTGAVLPAAGDYDASEVNDDSAVGGADVAASLDILDATKAEDSVMVTGSGLATGGGDLSASRVIDVPKASGAEVAALTNDTKAVTPLGLASLTLSGIPDYIAIDKKAFNANGGAFLSLTTVRDLTDTVRDSKSFGALSANGIPLPVGTFYVRWETVTGNLNQNALSYIRERTDDANRIYGSVCKPSQTHVQSTGAGLITLAAPGHIELVIRGNTTRSGTDVLGEAHGISGFDNIYTNIEVFQVS